MNYLKEFEKIVNEQIKIMERKKENSQFVDFTKLSTIKIGVIAGDGIGKIILRETKKVLNHLLKDEISSNKIILKEIEGLTLENRIAENKAVPDDVLKEIKECNVLLKGPTTTPSKSDNMPNISSANVTLRKELDLFANVRPVCIPEKNIDWIFFRENTEGEYALGSSGLNITDELSIDFKVTTDIGTKRLAKLAFEYAKNNNKNKVSIVTKANIMKKTDGKFLDICMNVAKDYPDIEIDSWYVDIMSANLINESLQDKFQVFILPNLYGDIITDEAAELQGGVGTAGSSNIGAKYAMFEAIHGSAPRMVESGLAEYANPASLMRAAEMMLKHIGYAEKAEILSTALDYASSCTNVTGEKTGDLGSKFTEKVLEKL